MKIKLLIIFIILFSIIQIEDVYGQRNWKLYQNKEGRFSILVPSKPKREVDIIESVSGMKVKQISFFSKDENNPNSAFYISYFDVPREMINSISTDQLLEAGMIGAASNVNGEIIIERKISLNGYPGAEFVVESASYKPKDTTMKMRAYIVRNRMYALSITSIKGTLSNYVQDKYLDSFKLIHLKK